MKKVLVVDDEPAILDMLVAVLEDEGYAAIAADNGIRALELMALEQPDLLLLDIMMPGMDGREVCRRMRDLPGREKTRVIMISAALSPDLTECPVAAFLPKPFDLDELLKAIESVLGEQNGANASR